ncbi:MAG: pantoate--beta-alanine ligase, partial [Thermodesulfobacteriota bacterium]
MKVISTISQFRETRRGLHESVGFVPTMGYLHQGHLALVRRARADNDVAVVSIFVNPTQFGPNEDFDRYPRDEDRDLALLAEEGVDLVFLPGAAEMYPPGFDTWVEVKGLTERLEGVSRPGHFRGVATVVTKLFNIVRPAKAYFGQKDAQQVAVIQKMVADLDMDLEVVVVPTQREPDGLAMSSRNIYLNAEQRSAATILWRALLLAQDLWSQGERSAEELRRRIRGLIGREALARIDYVSVADPRTL